MKTRKRFAIILALMMIFSSFEVMGVFAAGNSTSTDSGSTSTKTTAVVVTGVEDVQNLVAYASFESVVLEWDKAKLTQSDSSAAAKYAEYYLVNDTLVKPDVVKDAEGKDTNRLRYAFKGVNPGYAVTFNVYGFYDPTGAYKDPKVAGALKSAKAATTIKAPVRTIAYRVTIKQSGKLKSHGGPSAKMKVHVGDKLDCYGFGGGKYIYKNENGSIFYINMTRTGKKKCIYEKTWNYTPQEAEFFVNMKGLASKTNTLIWINTYTQHLYVFAGTMGNWKCVKDFECSTGKASSPSPTGVSGEKTVWKKISTRHGIKYWTLYSDINAIHGKRKGWKIGVPSSNGCVRNYPENAKFVYENSPKGTRVFLY